MALATTGRHSADSARQIRRRHGNGEISQRIRRGACRSIIQAAQGNAC